MALMNLFLIVVLSFAYLTWLSAVAMSIRSGAVGGNFQTVGANRRRGQPNGFISDRVKDSCEIIPSDREKRRQKEVP